MCVCVCVWPPKINNVFTACVCVCVCVCVQANYNYFMHFKCFVQHVMFEGEKRMKNLMGSYRQNGLMPRTHGNSHGLPKRTLSYESIKDIVIFLQNYVEQNGLLLPGRVLQR